MFDLKKYKVVKSFNGYREGMTVAFNGADAEKYAEFIVSTKRVAPVVVEPIIETKAEEQPKKRKYVRKGRK